MRSNRWYKRRLPLLTELPPPAAPRPLVFRPGVFARRDPPPRGVFVPIRPPWKAPPKPKILTPSVARSDFRRDGQIVWSRPPFKPVVNVPGRLPVPLVVRSDAWSRMRPGLWHPIGLPSVPAAPFAKTDRIHWLRAAARTVFDGRAAIGTAFNLRASEAMSVPSNISFFQGEDIQLNFALNPPTDITGWTLTGTVQNKLGGTTQFTFTPSIQDAGRGWFQASFPRTQTSNLPPGDYVWDIRRTDSGKNAVLAHGEITLKQPVTP